MAGEAKIIFWNDRPKRQLRALLEFHLEYHSHKAAENFQKKLEAKLERIRRYPETGQRTRYKSVRRMRVDKHRSVFFRIHGRKIFIVFIWDGRQHPTKNPYRKK